MKIIKPVLSFIGGVTVGILAVTGVQALEDDVNPESIDDDTDFDEEIEPEEDILEDEETETEIKEITEDVDDDEMDEKAE